MIRANMTAKYSQYRQTLLAEEKMTLISTCPLSIYDVNRMTLKCKTDSSMRFQFQEVKCLPLHLPEDILAEKVFAWETNELKMIISNQEPDGFGESDKCNFEFDFRSTYFFEEW